MQSAWLIIGSIGRTAAGLPISPMETFTLAFIVSTVMSYFFWWRKPQNVETPVIICCEHTMAEIRRVAGLAEDSWTKSPTEFIDIEHKRWKRRTMFDVSASSSRQRLPDPEASPSPLASTISVSSPTNTVASDITLFPTASLRTGTAASDKSISPIVSQRMDTAATDKTLLPTVSEKALPPRIYDDSILPCGLTPLVLLSVALPSMVHSAIHLLGWNFDYPTYTEKIMWRSAALVLNVMAGITVGGVRVLTVIGYKGRFNLIWIWVNNPVPDAQTDAKQDDSASQATKSSWWRNVSFWDVVLTICTLCLLLARFFIIAEVLISFRSLPKDVFVTVNWVDFIPHV